MSELTERLRDPNNYLSAIGQVRRAAEELERWERATGGLDPALVAKALTLAADTRLTDVCNEFGWTTTEAGQFLAALRTATFETT